MQKTILITGCSSGIGLAAARGLTERGYRVFASARQEKDIAMLQNEGFEAILLDVNDSDSIKRAMDTILAKTRGTLYALFNNAGYVQAGAVEDLSREMMRKQFETNVFGAMELVNTVLPIMRKQGYGRIIQNSSLLSIVTMPYRGAYNASKFALEGFSSTLRQELKGSGIHVSVLVPGPIETQLRGNAHQHYQATLKTKQSVHQDTYEKMENYFFHPQPGTRRFTLRPEAVLPKLQHALESKHPHAHYLIGFPAYLFAILRRILPDIVLDWVLKKIIHAESNNGSIKRLP